MPPGLSENNLTSNYSESYVSEEIQHNGRENSLTLRKLSQIGNMNLEGMHRKSVALCGVALTDDKGLGKCTEDNKIILLGTICLEDVKMKLEDLRKALCAEMSVVPEGFVFVSKEGWPLLKKHESFLRANHVISDKNTIFIKRQFEKEKIGIVLSGGSPLGFIFADVNSNLRQIRETIEIQLKMSQQLKMEYRFVERNGWPVMQCQETLLSLMDIVLGQVVYIQNSGKINEQPSPVLRPKSMNLGYDTTPSENRTPTVSEGQDGGVLRRKKSLKGILRPDTQQSHRGKKESQKRNKIVKDDLDLAQPILISYARAEAAQHALLLKQELVRRGYSVYLDVHEIKTGSDWQDSLNFAVTHCFLFVPLITPMYGKTQWTNREIKLADVLGKLIVPVNFEEKWPPACLAIQFASTQYIPWKLLENDQGKNEQDKTADPRKWPAYQIERVAKLITDCYRDNCGPLPKRQMSMREAVPKLRPCTLSSVMKEDVYRTTSNPYDEAFDDNKHSIVISVHPKQRALAQELKELLTKEGNMVWCSNNWQENHESLSLDDKNFSMPNTPRDLPTIAEGEVFFGQHDRDREVFYSSGDNKKSNSCYREPEAYGRRPLSRLMSQFSDISQPSTLNQEKLARLHIFQQKVDQAGVVVVLVSEDYVKSTFSHQQIFYCEQRKRVVLVKCDDNVVPKWFKLLMGNDMIMPKSNNPQFECVLKARVKRALNPSSSETPKDASFEAKINYLVNFLKCNLPLQDTRVYITGSSKLQTARSEEICRAVGRELSKVLNISVVTGGFFGVPDITAKSFYEQRECSTQSYVEDPAVVHILPIHESEDLKSKANQNPDGSFEVVPYGKTFFLGDSLKERETVVARLLDMCIVIEGGPGVVHEVEEFIWNDHFVIPIHSTGGAAGGQYGIPMKIFELPPGVDAVDWNLLSDQSALPEDVAKAVVNIIFSLKKAVSSPTATLKTPGFLTRKNRKKLKKQKSQVKDESEVDSNTSLTSEPAMDQVAKYKMEETSRYHGQSKLTFKKRTWWQRLFGFFRRKRNPVNA